MKKISIIIPVYNTSEYLEQCIDSILEQEFRDYEIILVDDGSKDSSPQICDFYADRYDFITVIHKENGGLSDARNTGLKCACGEYVLFIDSDDYIFKESLSVISRTIDEKPDVDVIFLEAVKVFPDGTTINLKDGYQKEAIYMKPHKDVLKHISNLPKFPGSACTKLVKRSLINDNKLYFEKGLLSEDIDWTIRLLITAQTFNYCHINYYYYRQNREGSITNTANISNVYSLLYIIKKWSRELSNSSNIIELQEHINACIAYEYIIVLLLYGKLNHSDKVKVKKEVKSYAWLLRESKTKKVRIIKFLNEIFGFEAVSAMLSIYHRLR